MIFSCRCGLNGLFGRAFFLLLFFVLCCCSVADAGGLVRNRVELFELLYGQERGAAPVGLPSGGIFDRFPVFIMHNPECVNGYKITYDGSDPVYHGKWFSGSHIYWQSITKSQTVKAVCLDYYMQPSQVGVYSFRLNGLSNIPATKLRTGLFSGPQPVNMNYPEAVEVPVEVENFAVLSAYGRIKTEYRVTGSDAVMTGRVDDKFNIWVAGVSDCPPPRRQNVRYRSIMARFVHEYKVEYTKEPQYEPINNYAGHHYQEMVCE